MKKAAWILAIFFGLAFLGATLMNAGLIARSRRALAGGFRARSAAEAARYHLVVVLPDTDDSFFQGLLEGIRESAGAAGSSAIRRYSPSSSPARPGVNTGNPSAVRRTAASSSAALADFTR